MGLDMVKLGARTYYFPGGTNVGMYSPDGKDAYLIDSGNDKEAGRRLLSALNAGGYRLKAVLNTHSNADHCGGNQFLQDRTSCDVICPEIESAFLQHPILEPSLLYGGMAPPELLSKFFMAKPSIVEKGSIKKLPEGVKPIDLPGHYFGMCGYLTDDRVFFAADSLFSQQVLEKYHISFIHDVASFLATLEMLPSIDCDLFVPSHAQPAKDIGALAAINRDKVNEISALVYDSCKQPSSPDDVLKRIFDHYGLLMDMGQYALAGSTIRSFITYLRSQGRLEQSFEGNRLLYRSI